MTTWADKFIPPAPPAKRTPPAPAARSGREWPSKVMVLVYQPLLTCSVWIDYYSRARTKAGLLRHLRQSVKRGEYIGYRLIYDMDETIGVDLNSTD